MEEGVSLALPDSSLKPTSELIVAIDERRKEVDYAGGGAAEKQKTGTCSSSSSFSAVSSSSSSPLRFSCSSSSSSLLLPLLADGAAMDAEVDDAIRNDVISALITSSSTASAKTGQQCRT